MVSNGLALKMPLMIMLRACSKAKHSVIAISHSTGCISGEEALSDTYVFLCASRQQLRAFKRIKLLFNFPKTCFHFQNGFQNEISFPKCGFFSKCAFIFKMWKVPWVLFFLSKNTIVNKKYRYIKKLLNLFHRIYDLL